MMIKKLGLTWLFFLCSTSLYAQMEPLDVAVSQFSPPYVMQGKNQLYGFDIAMMDYICNIIQRNCQYHLMPFEAILPAVVNNTDAVAIGSITITVERAKTVHFSIPYLVSNARFIGPSKLGNQPLSLDLLQHSRIGIKSGSIFGQQLALLGINNPTIVSYKLDEELIAALIANNIDLALIDEPAAMYWQSNSDGKLIALGKPYPYGGLGIAVSQQDLPLLQKINQALIQFQQSKAFTNAYVSYIQSSL